MTTKLEGAREIWAQQFPDAPWRGNASYGTLKAAGWSWEDGEGWKEATAYTPRRWTEREELELMKLLGTGHPYHAIARLLNRSVASIRDKTHRLGFQASKIETVFPRASLQTRFMRGLTGARAMLLVKFGVLSPPHVYKPPTKRGQGKWRRYRFTLPQLEEFLAREDGWMLWEPEDLLIPWLKEFWVEHRREAGWRWVRMSDAERMMHYVPRGGQNLRKRKLFDPNRCVSWTLPQGAGQFAGHWVDSRELARVMAPNYAQPKNPADLESKYGVPVRRCFLHMPQEQREWLAKRGPWANIARDLLDGAMKGGLSVESLSCDKVPWKARSQIRLAPQHIQHLEQFGPWDDALRGLIQAAMEREQWER